MSAKCTCAKLYCLHDHDCPRGIENRADAERRQDEESARYEALREEGRRQGAAQERAATLAWLRHLGLLSREMASAFPPGPLRACYAVLVTAYEGGADFVERGGHHDTEAVKAQSPGIAPKDPT